MDYSIYVGPYLTIVNPKGFDWMDWADTVCDGQMEAGDKKTLTLIPNVKLEGVDRQMRFGRHEGADAVVQINPAMIVKETGAFSKLVQPIEDWCDDNGVECRLAWGVVPCWS
jgi:hypothetical protein